jgi:transcriptional regulator with XRE-family HTH domain
MSPRAPGSGPRRTRMQTRSMSGVPTTAAEDGRDDSHDASDQIAHRLREAREQAGLSLRQLAKRLDISASALSQIETGKSLPSVRTLYAVVSELGISFDQLFDQEGARGSASSARPSNATGRIDDAAGWMARGHHPCLRSEDRPRLELDTGVEWQRLTAQHDALVDFVHVTYKPGSASNPDSKLLRHAGWEYGVVLSGALNVTIGFETYQLTPGDSISFSSNEPHVLANNGSEPATAIWFVVGRRQSDPRGTVFEDSRPDAD